eukprot:6489151-Amphidinium_carterae.1
MEFGKGHGTPPPLNDAYAVLRRRVVLTGSAQVWTVFGKLQALGPCEVLSLQCPKCQQLQLDPVGIHARFGSLENRLGCTFTSLTLSSGFSRCCVACSYAARLVACLCLLARWPMIAFVLSESPSTHVFTCSAS